MKRYNGVGGYPRMEEAKNGHWVTFHDHQLALLDANKKSERNWEATCCSEDKIRQEFDEQLSKQQLIIVIESAILFVIVGVFFLNWI